MSKEILINQLFAGSYLDEAENIGHEIINLFRDDDGNSNLFITPSGRIKGHDIEYILFVRNVSARRTVEVVGLAKNIQRVEHEDAKSIRYANVSLNQIFGNNVYHGGDDVFADHVTFRAGVFLLPSQRIFITLDDNQNTINYTLRLQSTRKVITPQSLREYYSDKSDADAYAQLKALIEDNSYWDENNTTEKLIPDGSVQNMTPSFLEVIRKEDDEVIFSNLLGYYFEYSHTAFQRFANDVLKIPTMRASFNVLRETMNRIDIWIESETDIIVIENKIKSGINGITGDDYSQLNKYYETAQQIAEEQNKNTHFYIFAPDYARFDLSQYGVEEVYKVIKYSEIYRFFIKETETYITDHVFPDFIRGLKRHTLSFPELQFDTMRSRLLRKINNLQ